MRCPARKRRCRWRRRRRRWRDRRRGSGSPARVEARTASCSGSRSDSDGAPAFGFWNHGAVGADPFQGMLAQDLLDSLRTAVHHVASGADAAHAPFVVDSLRNEAASLWQDASAEAPSIGGFADDVVPLTEHPPALVEQPRRYYVAI
eukprot:TRINITY_DN29169_c0_g1_i1.p3 TRINITY_DN29169_c0_g1~~TRINITY_DN29169_c0_g1_i1.p3  ORF type:complete len:147 (+),score=24.17 TRINITY_DN29169_c0_g1_i1:402-842(+)